MYTREYCELRFNTSLNSTRTIRIPDPSTAVNEAVARNASTHIMDADPFDETVGSLTGLDRADRIIITRIPILS